MRRLAAALAFLALLAIPARADTPLTSSQNYQGHWAYGLGAPGSAPVPATAPELYGGHAPGSFPASTSGNFSDIVCSGSNFLPQWTGSAWTCTSATGALFGSVGPLSIFGNASNGSGAPSFVGPGTAGEVPIVNAAGTSWGWGLIPQTSIVAPYAAKGVSRAFFIDNDGGSDNNDCLTSSTPCKTLDGGVAPKVPTDLGGGALTLNFLPRASCAAYLKADGVTTENFATLNSLINSSFLIVEGNWFRTGSTPAFGMSTIPTGTNAAGYDVSSYATPSWGPTITVTLHGGGAVSFPAENSGSTTLLGYQWRWDPATTTVALRNTTTTIMGATSNTVTFAGPPLATPVAGDFGYIEAPCFTVGTANVGASFPGGGGLNSLIEFIGVSATTLNVNAVSDVVFSRVVASTGGINFAHSATVSSSSRFWGGLFLSDDYGTEVLSNLYFGLLQVSRGGQLTASRFAGGQILADGINGPGAVVSGLIPNETTAAMNIGDVPGATTNTQSRLITVGTNVAGIYSFNSNLRVGSVNWEDGGTAGLFFPINFSGQGNTIYVDGVTDAPPHGGSPTAWMAAGIIDLQAGSPVNSPQPSHDNNIIFGPHQTGLADATRLSPNADIHLSSVSPLDGQIRVQYTLQLDTLKYVGAVTTGDGTRLYSYASNGLAPVKAWAGLWDPDLTIPTGPPVTNDLGRFRVARASSTPGLLVLADSSSAANAANVVGVNIDSLPDPSGTNYDRYGSPLIVSEGIVPIITQDVSPTIPSPVWLSPQYPRGVVTTVKPATNAYQIGVAIADLGAFSENLQGQVPPELTTVSGRLLRVQLGPLNATAGGSISGPLGSVSVNAINDSGGAAHAIGSISASQIVITDGSGHVTTASTIPWTDISGVPTFLGDPGGNGIVVRTASGVTTARTITSTGASINVANGNGGSGNPNVDVNLDGVTLDQGVGGVVQVAPGGIGTTQLASGGVTYAKVQNETASTLIGNPGVSAAAPSEITLGAHCSFTGSVLDCSGGGGGSVTAVTASPPLFSSGGATPNITDQGAFVSGSTSTTAQNLGSISTAILACSTTTGVCTIDGVTVGGGLNFNTSTAALTDGTFSCGANTWMSSTSASGPACTSIAFSNLTGTATLSQVNAPTGTGLVGVTSGAWDSAATVVSTGLTRSGGNLTVNLSTGVSGGQTAIGGTGIGENLILSSTSNATKGKIEFGGTSSYYDEANSLLVAPVGGLTTPGISFAGFTTDGFSTILSGARISTIIGGVRTVDVLSGEILVIPNGSGFGGIDVTGGGGGRLRSSGTNVFVESANGSVNFNSAALATSFTAGYLTMPSTAGVPTGTPATIPTAQIPVVFDTADKRFYAYVSSGWHPYAQDTGALASGPLCNTTTTGLWSACTIGPGINASGTTVRLGSVASPSAPTIARFGDSPPTTASAATLGSLYQWDPVTLTLTGTTTVTSETTGLAFFKSPTVSGGGAVIVNDPFTVAISGAPFLSGVTAGDHGALALWVQSGSTQLDGALGINGVSVPSNQMFVAGHNQEAARDSASFFLGGSSSTNAGDYFHLFGTTTSLPTSTYGRLTTMTIDQMTYNSGGTATLTNNEASLYVKGKPLLGTGTFIPSGGAQYTAEFGDGVVKIDGDSTFGYVNGPRVFQLPNNTNHSPAGGSPTMVVEVFITGVGEKFLYLYDN